MALPDISKLKRYVALVIQFDPHTGVRSGNIDVRRDRGLFCLPLWQDLTRGVEMRLVLDDRDIEQYRGVEGIEVVEGKAAINAKVRELFKPRYGIVSGALLSASIAAKDRREGKAGEPDVGRQHRGVDFKPTRNLDDHTIWLRSVREGRHARHGRCS